MSNHSQPTPFAGVRIDKQLRQRTASWTQVSPVCGGPQLRDEIMS